MKLCDVVVCPVAVLHALFFFASDAANLSFDVWPSLASCLILSARLSRTSSANAAFCRALSLASLSLASASRSLASLSFSFAALIVASLSLSSLTALCLSILLLEISDFIRSLATFCSLSCSCLAPSSSRLIRSRSCSSWYDLHFNLMFEYPASYRIRREALLKVSWASLS